MTPQRITIILCTFNGAAYLEAQLQSYLAQSHSLWDLWVSDDGSTDETWAVLEKFQRDHGQGREIRVLRGPGRGACVNFLSLLCHPDLPAGPVALSDQDDMWMPQKLARALAALGAAGPLALYGAQSLHCDAGLRVLGQSVSMPHPPTFGIALVQNVVSGHSAVLSADAVALVRSAGVPNAVPFHDWWLYQLISGAGGDIVIDPDPVLYYRQHGANVMGAHRGLRARIDRITVAMGGRYGDWIAANLAALAGVERLLTAENRKVLTRLRAQPRRAGLARARAFAACGVRRQSLAATAVLYVALMLGRV
ncbi:glycosyltransferase [Pseudorhodobacter ferrugineus]|uniref:glycosyltransferase n=1 Tax=Pseudorhodobacter ferrugineus TaxID=77008 RepID=UPI0003F59BA7|nr:glycosyltransferase [Pseudorhodobacter ferrugineus]